MHSWHYLGGGGGRNNNGWRPFQFGGREWGIFQNNLGQNRIIKLFAEYLENASQFEVSMISSGSICISELFPTVLK